MARAVPLLLCALLAACSSGSPRQHDGRVAASNPLLQNEYAFTHTHEVRFGESQQVVGYLVEFLRMPEGLEDQRDFPPGTVLLQDARFETIGMITPGREGIVFDAEGAARSLGHGGREQLVMAAFQRSERPHFTSILPGVLPAER